MIFNNYIAKIIRTQNEIIGSIQINKIRFFNITNKITSSYKLLVKKKISVTKIHVNPIYAGSKIA